MDRAALYDDLRTAIGAAWTDVPENGIFRARELARIDWTRQAPETPVAVIDLDSRSTAEFGTANKTEMGELTIYYIVDDATDADELDAKLLLLQEELHGLYTTNLQIIGWPGATQSIRLPVNQFFLGAALPFYAGAVVALVQYA